VVNMDWDLSLRDIKFLRAVRDINGNPEAYEKTDVGQAPANKQSIRLATDLGKKEVGYRLGGKGGRGLENGEEPLIERLEPEPIAEENRFGPRSARLTEHGLEALSEFEESGMLGSGSVEDEPETIKQLRARIEELESQKQTGSAGGQVDDEIVERLEAIERQLEVFNEQAWGSVSDEKAEGVESLLELSPPAFHVIETIFGIDLNAVREQDGFNEGEIPERRREVLARLQQFDTGGGGTMSESGSRS
jgi:hypothetical protein